MAQKVVVTISGKDGVTDSARTRLFEVTDSTETYVENGIQVTIGKVPLPEYPAKWELARVFSSNNPVDQGRELMSVLDKYFAARYAREKAAEKGEL